MSDKSVKPRDKSDRNTYIKRQYSSVGCIYIKEAVQVEIKMNSLLRASLLKTISSFWTATICAMHSIMKLLINGASIVVFFLQLLILEIYLIRYRPTV